ncbi:class I SAM-dependent methyltransferase [Haloferula sp. A504]|uniref:class I SAM-dependent methyltransferase n=1 Tax=Haloferula sp. A504 TaxID=3373601 RepID=UPI0031BDC398|nr:class I SAM-dependent methyltransferase [Verrucomicrobiaceae bacterium E54]
MDPRETARSYDALADHWSGDGFHRENGIDQHKRAIRFSRKSGVAIDIGCGSSGRIIDLLRDSGFAVEGLDISQGMLKQARARHPDVEFHLADIVTWDFPKQYDFISAWDSVWHVPLEHQEEVLRKLCAGLAGNGVLIYTSGGVDTPEEGSNPFMGQPLYHAALGIPKLLEVVSEMDCVCRHLEYDQASKGDVGKHLYLIVQKSERGIA